MRVLHAVTPQETFVASGTYLYRRGDVILGGVEHFSVHQQPDHAHFIRIDYDWREAYQTSQLIEALTDPTGQLVFSRVVAQIQRGSTLKRETYDFHPDRVYIGITGEGGARQDIEQALPLGYLPLFTKTALLGWALAAWPATEAAQTFSGYRDDQRTAVVTTTRACRTGPEITAYGEGQGYDILQAGEQQHATLLPQGIVAQRTHDDLYILLTQYAHRAVGGAQ
jgi:hypothetical protein